jgi:hypothetical protein
MGCGLDDWGSIPGRRKIFLFSIVFRPVLGHIPLPIQWISGALFQKVKRQRREADHSSPTSAEVKNGTAIPPLHHKSSWRGV